MPDDTAATDVSQETDLQTLRQAREQSQSDYSKIIAEESDLNKRIQAEALRERNERLPYYADIAKAEEDYSKTARENRPAYQMPARPPNTQEMTAPTNLQKTFGMTAVFALLAAGVTKGASMGALTALGGFMKGAREGNMEAAKAAIADYNMNMDYTIQVNKIAEKKYEDILTDKKMTLDQKERALKIKMLEHEDDQWMLQLEQKGMTAIHQLMNQRNTLNHQMATEIIQTRRLEAQMAHWTRQDDAKAAGGANTVMGIPIAQIPTVEPGQKNDAFLAMLPPAQAQLVRQMANGQLPVSGFGGLDVKTRSDLVKAAAIYDPLADMRKYAVGAKALTELTPGGPVGTNVLAINTMTHHIDQFARDFSQLNNSQVQKWNDAKNKLAAEFGDPALGLVQQDAIRVADEYARIIKGGRASPTEQDMRLWETIFTAKLSPQQMRTAVWNALEGAGGRLSAIQDAYAEFPEQAAKMISPETKAIVRKWKPKSVPDPAWLTRGEGPQPRAVGGEVKPGGTLTTDEARAIVKEIKAANPNISQSELRAKVVERAKALGKTW